GRRTVVEPARLTALVLIRQVTSVAPPEAIDLAGQTNLVAGQLDAGPLVAFVGFEPGVQLAAGVNTLVGDADFFDLFQIEKAMAIPQRMQSHDPQGRGVGINRGQSDHELPPMRVQAVARPSLIASGSDRRNRSAMVFARTT